MENALQLPLIPLGQEGSGEYLVFLPGLDSEELEEVAFEIDQDEDVFYVLCQYGETDDGEPIGDSYPIQIHEHNRDLVQDMENLLVLHPDDKEVEELSDDPEIQEELENLFVQIKELEKQLEEQSPEVDPTDISP